MADAVLGPSGLRGMGLIALFVELEVEPKSNAEAETRDVDAGGMFSFSLDAAACRWYNPSKIPADAAARAPSPEL